MHYPKQNWSGPILAFILMWCVGVGVLLLYLFFTGCAPIRHEHEIIDTEARLLKSAEKWRGQNISAFKENTATPLRKASTQRGMSIYIYSIKGAGDSVNVDGVQFTTWWDCSFLTVPNGTIVDVYVRKRLSVSR